MNRNEWNRDLDRGNAQEAAYEAHPSAPEVDAAGLKKDIDDLLFQAKSIRNGEFGAGTEEIRRKRLSPEAQARQQT